MPIADKDLGKYKRPGIFINEIDNSIVELPVQNVLINLVPGFSKKGPVNRPVYITNTVDFKKIFGDIDRGLERKGSYFHRTCIKMLQTGPIWALNLLSTNDTRDKLSWKSISCGSAFENSVTRLMPYSRVFNRQDFWERDTESFLDYVNDPSYLNDDRLLHITNMGEKTITVLMYKSTVSGFDVTAENWYGGITKVPSYIHPKDWMSDYIISVLVLEGDWTDYNNLAVDSTWGKYFTTTGLDKTKVQDFVNESNVTTLAFYDVSLIPYFKDISGRDMYIKTVINNNTDRTGLFCAYNEDSLMDSDYPTGLMDLVGDGIVGLENTSIDFLSYNESIVENKTYAHTVLDAPGNVFGNYSDSMPFETAGFPEDSRTGHYTNWYMEDASVKSTGTTLYKISDCINSSGASWFTIDGDPTNSPDADWHKAFDAIGNTDYPFPCIVYFNDTYSGQLSANTAYYIQNITDGGRWFSISETYGGSPIVLTDTIPVSNLYIQRINLLMILNPEAKFNLAGSQYTFDTGSTMVNFEPLTFTGSLTAGHGQNRYDVLYVTPGDLATVNVLKGTQKNSGTADKPLYTLNYEDAIILGYVHHHIVSGVTTSASTEYAIVSDYTPVTMKADNLGNGFMALTGVTITGYTSGIINYVKLDFNGTSGDDDPRDYLKIRYKGAYNEIETNLSNYTGLIINYTNGYKYPITTGTFKDASRTSNAYITIPVSTGTGGAKFTDFYNSSEGIWSWLLYYVDNEFVIKTSADRLMTSYAPVESLVGSGQTSLSNAGVIGKYSDFYIDYYEGNINNGNFGYKFNNVDLGVKIYIKAWLQDTDKVYIDFMADSSTSSSPLAITNWSTDYPDGYVMSGTSQFILLSNNSSYKQTLEIEDFDNTKMPALVYEISIDKTRYSEVKKGDFIEAYYDTTVYDDSTGALYGIADPKKLARIIDVKLSSTNSNWKIIKTDVPMKITAVPTTSPSVYDYQTTIYPQIDVYVSTYKGVKLTPFTIHQDSMPNNTNERQSSILDVMGKTTNLAKGLVNKNKISWRYLVDSFGLGLSSLSKQQYADLCAMKLNCLAFVNAPSVKTLKASASPSFVNDDMTLNTAYLKAGGDESKNPSFLYSFAEGQGRSCMGYFFPYVRIDDNGIPKEVPPAAWIASTYMQKHISSSAAITPWTIAAGISNGRVTDIGGVEMDFNDEDLENLYAMNLNPIVKKRNAGYCINSESTAQVFPYSSLSVIHSREVLIELENSLYDMLLRYQWRFNTPEIRGEIKFRADKICKDLQDRNALYNFKNVIDETNNTNYIIDLQMGVLDTYIEIIKGMGIIVNNITILKKGDIESGGFM